LTSISSGFVQSAVSMVHERTPGVLPPINQMNPSTADSADADLSGGLRRRLD
jgi:hypothetical protein